MRTIRKVQTDCEIIHQFFTQLYDSNNESNNEVTNQHYEGTVFGKIVKNDGSIHYMVFIESIQLLARINTHVNVPNYSKQLFKIFLFEDEHKVKKMIRLQIL